MRLIDCLAYDLGNLRFSIKFDDAKMYSRYTEAFGIVNGLQRYPTAVEAFEFFHGCCNYSLVKDVYISSIFTAHCEEDGEKVLRPIIEIEIIDDYNDYERYPDYQFSVIDEGFYCIIKDAWTFNVDILHLKRIMYNLVEYLRNLWTYERQQEEDLEGIPEIIHLVNAYYKFIEYCEDHGYEVPGIQKLIEFTNDPYNWILEYDIIKNPNPGSSNRLRLHELFFILANGRFENIHYGSHKQPNRICSSERIRDCIKDYVDGQFEFPIILEGYKQEVACMELDGDGINIAIDTESSANHDLYYGIIKDNRFHEDKGSSTLAENNVYRCHGFNVYSENAVNKINAIYKHFKSVNPDMDLTIGGFSNESEGIILQHLSHKGYIYLIVLQTKRLNIVIYNQTADCYEVEE